MSGDATSTRIGGFQPLAGKSWSENVGALANAARACYRVVNNDLLFENVGDQVHTLAESDGSFDRGAFKGERTRLAVNDVTVCGKEEPQAYVTEIFEGDGVTSVFQLGEAPLMEKATLLFDTFSGSAIDPQSWVVVDGGGHISLTSRGLTLGGGQGAGGASSVAAVDAVEMGGVLLIELSGLEVDSLGEGYFAGLSSGTSESDELCGWLSCAAEWHEHGCGADGAGRGSRRDDDAADRPHLYAAAALPLQGSATGAPELRRGWCILVRSNWAARP